MNIAQVLKAEISRISRHEAKVATTPIRRSAAKMRPIWADLKNRLAILEKEVKRLNLLAINLVSTQPAPAVASVEYKGWITGRGVKSLRGKLGLSQKEFGKLTGASPRAVVLWESKPGMLKLRDATKKAIMAVRGIGKVEARKKLEGMVARKVAKKKVKKAAGKKAGLKGRK